MTTPRTRSLVSLAAALTLTLLVGGCASTATRPAVEDPAAAEGPAPVVRFTNEANDYVHVYLVGERREWLLGRVERGARASLRIPEEALAEDAGPVWLAVRAGDRISLRVAGESRVASALRQPAAALLEQRWTYSQSLTNGQLTSLPLGRRTR